MKSFLRLVPAGSALIGISYGLARYSYGLFLPEMHQTVGLTPSVSGVIGGGSYAGYCLAVIAGVFLVERLGPRRVACAAGAVATGGMVLIAVSCSTILLAAAILIAGMSAGLASPPMAEAVSRVIPCNRQPRANTLINSGTSLGVALAGPIALVAGGRWREGYLAFAAIALATTVWTAFATPRRRAAPAGDGSPHVRTGLLRPTAVPVVITAAGMGFASSAYWTFGGERIVDGGHLSHAIAVLAWVVVGVAGLLGGAAGDLVRRYGINAVNRAFLLALAAATLALAVSPSRPVVVLVSAALFGIAFIMLTGVYLVWGVRIYADRPAIGLGLPFLMIAVGQIAGASVAGFLIDADGPLTAFTALAATAALTMLTRYRPLTLSQPGEGRI